MQFFTTLVIIACLSLTSLVRVASAEQEEDPSQFYQRYRAAVQSATSMEQVLAFWAAEQVNAFNSAPPSGRIDLDQLKKIYSMPTDVRIVSVQGRVTSSRSGATTSAANLNLEGRTADRKVVAGTAQLLKVDGAWKLAAPERWNGY